MTTQDKSQWNPPNITLLSNASCVRFTLPKNLPTGEETQELLEEFESHLISSVIGFTVTDCESYFRDTSDIVIHDTGRAYNVFIETGLRHITALKSLISLYAALLGQDFIILSHSDNSLEEVQADDLAAQPTQTYS